MKQYYDNLQANSHLIAIRHSSTTSNSSSSITELYDNLFWDSQGISNYDKSSYSSNMQILVNKGNSLTWQEYGKGKILVNQDDPKLDYLDNKLIVGQFLWKKVSEDEEGNKQLKIWTRALMQGFNIKLTSGNYEDDQQQPYVRLDCYRAFINTTQGLKKTVTKENENFTETYLLQIDYPNFALTVDSSISNLIKLEKSEGGIKIKSAVNGSGIIYASNGYLDVLSVPNETAVLAYNNGYIWATLGKGIQLKGHQIVNVCCDSLSQSSSESISISVSSSDSGSESISVSISQSESISESVSVSNSESISVSQSESKSESVSASKSESKSQSKSESVSASKSKSESKSDSKSQSKSDSKSQSKSDSKSQSKSDSKSQSKSESVSASKSESKSESVSQSESKSESGQGDPIDCTDWKVYSPFEGAGNITGYGNYVTETADCQGFVFHKSIYSFNGSYVNVTDCDYWSGEEECYQDEQTYTIWNGTWFDVWANCRTDSETGKKYIQVQLYGRDGYYNPALGPAIRIYDYGTYQLPHYNWDSDDCQYWSPEDGEQGQEGGWYGERSVVTSYPTFYVTIVRRNA